MNSTVCRNSPPRSPWCPGPSVTREKSWHGGAAEKMMMQRPQGSTFSITSATLVGSSSLRSPRHDKPGSCALATAVAPDPSPRRTWPPVWLYEDQPGGRADTVEYGQHDDLVAVGLCFRWVSLGRLGVGSGTPSCVGGTDGAPCCP